MIPFECAKIHPRSEHLYLNAGGVHATKKKKNKKATKSTNRDAFS